MVLQKLSGVLLSMPDVEEAIERLPDETLAAALRQPRRIRMEYFSRQLELHRGHPGFRTEGRPISREMGFSCDCSGERVEYLINVTEIRDLVPEVRDRYLRRRRVRPPGSKQKKRDKARAEKRSHALLCRHLTREQRQMLNGLGHFYVEAADGYTYRIEYGIHGNLKWVDPETDETLIHYCVSPEGVPAYDVMLAQKTYLELQPELLLEKANSWEPWTPQQRGRFREQVEESISTPVEIHPDDVENPGEWVVSQLYTGHLVIGIEDLLINDVLVRDQRAQYDVVTDSEFKGCVIHPDMTVLPYFGDGPLEIPQLPVDADLERFYVKLVTEYPYVSCNTWEDVAREFNASYLYPYAVMSHPDTDKRGFPTYLYWYTHEDFPVGKVYVSPDPSLTGVKVRWVDGSGVGLALTCTTIAVMEVNSAEESLESCQNHSGETISEEASTGTPEATTGAGVEPQQSGRE